VEFISTYQAQYPITMLCKVLDFPKSTYYRALDREPSNRQKEYEAFSQEVMAEYLKSKKRYGAGKIHKALLKRGIKCSIQRVQRHMKKQGIRSIIVKKYRPHSSKADDSGSNINILERNFAADKAYTKLVTDITYIHVLKEGWTYLASVMDLATRKIVGYAYGRRMTADLAVQAVKNACLNIYDTEGILIHSDLGSQYTSHEFREYIESTGMIQSFSRKGNPYDNACIESFHANLKKEEVYTTTYVDFDEAGRAIFEYIESWYNRQRMHSAIDYMTPQQREDELLAFAA